MKKPTLAQAEKALGPATKWAGRCFEIASRFVEKRLVEGTAIYGHWTGPIAKDSLFDRGIGFAQHGWVLLADGRVLDPTRFVFEVKAPYIYLGPADYYDEGGTKFRASRLGPAPEWEPDDKKYKLTHRVMPSSATWNFVEKLLGIDVTEQEPGTLCRGQLFWLANQSPQVLGPYAPAVYQAICAMGKTGLIPIDNLRRVERENGIRFDSKLCVPARTLNANKGEED